MFKRYLVFIILILLTIGSAATNVFLQQKMSVKPAAFEPEAAAKVDDFLSQLGKKDMPGCGVGVVQNGKLVYKRAFGMANLDYDVPNTTSTLFNLASSSKPFTAMSIALLAQQGKLSLDDDIRKYVPEMPEYEDSITLRHLLYHTSGIREYQALILFGSQNPDNDYSDKNILEMLARQKNINFKPGSKYQYSNSNYHLLGIIVGRVSGKSLRVFAEENIFKPLGMKNTLFFDNRNEIVKNRAAGYIIGQDKSVRVRSSLFDLVGGGGVLTTVEDLSLWVQNFDEPKVGNKELIRLLTTPGTLTSGEKINYALGLFHNNYKGLPVIKHSGNMSGFRSQIVSFPEQKFTAIALCNNMAIFPSAIAEKIADIYLEGQFKPAAPSRKNLPETLPPAIPLTAKDAPRYAGTYANLETGKAFKLTLKDGKLINSGLLQNEIPVTPVSENRLLLVAGADVTELNPVFDKSGKISEINMFIKGGKPEIFVPVKPPPDSPKALAEYAGTYYSDELNADYKLESEGGNLFLQISESLKPQLTPEYADCFTTAGGQINLVFIRANKGRFKGKITGFIFNSAGGGSEVKKIIFKRRP